MSLIAAMAHNYPAMNVLVKKASSRINKGKTVSEGLLYMVEMAFRAYYHCMACTTHILPGQMPLEVVIYNSR